MVIHKTVKGYVIFKNRNDTYDPPTSISLNWKHWKATWDIKTCKGCKDMHGKIYAVSEEPNPAPPLHPNCRCVVEPMDAVAVGVGTKDGAYGADWWLRNHGVLPSNYISEANLLLWDGTMGSLRQSTFKEKWQQWESIKIEMDIYRKHLDVHGRKRISTITAARGMVIELFGRMMG